jgi:unsaturated chondroitin disaccharide hydrolase
MMRRIMLIVAVAIGCTSVFGAAAPFYTTALDSAKSQLNRLTASLGTTYNRFPRTVTNGSVTTVSYTDWTCGFFPGCLWLMYTYTSDATWKTRARNWMDNLKSAATMSDHDVGFRIMCSYGQGLQYQTAAQFKLDTAVMILAARTLAGRYNGAVKAIKSWNTYAKNGVTYTYPVIIDNMMNLELLTWATRTGRDSSFQKDAVNHAATTRKNHFRANYSSFHLVAYDVSTGAVIKKMTVQGYSDSSSWARGQGWALYGYTMMYREIRDTAYLNQATRIADYIISRLPADNVPYWDFDAPASPTPPRDASAAAIYASALIELSTFVQGNSRQQTYYQKAKAILQSLASSAYTAAPNTNGNFILMHSTGNKPSNGEVDVPIIYADYYYLEALLRLRKIEESTSTGPVVAGIAHNNRGAVRSVCLMSGPCGFRIGIAMQEKNPLMPLVYDIRGRRMTAGTKIYRRNE